MFALVTLHRWRGRTLYALYPPARHALSPPLVRFGTDQLRDFGGRAYLTHLIRIGDPPYTLSLPYSPDLLSI